MQTATHLVDWGPPTYPWAERFIELALRGIRRTHYEYSVWLSGGNTESLAALNTGHGIELADERAVCAAVTQEFIARRHVSDRLWQIDREVNYEHKSQGGGTQKVDIVVERAEQGSSGSYLRAFIEAKRAQLWSVSIETGEAQIGACQAEQVAKDVEKLRNERDFRRQLREDVLIHLLVWGVLEQRTPRDFFDRVCGKVASCGTLCIHQVILLPLEWKNPTAGDLIKELQGPLATRTLWVALVEIDAPSGT